MRAAVVASISLTSKEGPDTGKEVALVVYLIVFKSDHKYRATSDILTTMPDTGERREITSRVNAKEAKTIQQSDDLAAKTKRLTEIASTKTLARRRQKRNGTPRARKNMP